MRANAQQARPTSGAGAVVIPLRLLPPEPHLAVAVLRRELLHEAIETAGLLGLPFVHASSVVEALVARGWLRPDAREHAVLLERRLGDLSYVATVEQVRGLEVLAEAVIGWLRMGANRVAAHSLEPPESRHPSRGTEDA